MADKSTNRGKRGGLTKEDHDALREYFGHGGMAKLEQSPLGYQLDLLERHGRQRQCWVCCGAGRLPPGTAALRKHAKALHGKTQARAWVTLQLAAVRVPRQLIGKHLSEYRRLRDEEHRLQAAERYRRKHAQQIREEAQAEYGPRALAAERWMRAEAESLRAQADIRHDGWCYFCHGTGWIPATLPDGTAPTARPTGSSVRTESQMELSDLTIERLGRATRLLRQIDPKHHQVFAQYYEPSMGGVRAVWEITPMGRELLRQHQTELAAARQERELAAWQVLHEVCEQQRHFPDPKRGRQLDVMRAQAREMVREAMQDWAEARDASSTPKRSLVPQRSAVRVRAPRSQALDQLANMVREALELGAA